MKAGVKRSSLIFILASMGIFCLLVSSYSAPIDWDFEPDYYTGYPYYLPVHGTAMIDGVNLAEGDWIGVFDEDGNCYGAGQYGFDALRSEYYYTLQIYAESDIGNIPGFQTGEKLYFRFYIESTEEELDAYLADNAEYLYPDVKGGEDDPVRIDLLRGEGISEFFITASAAAGGTITPEGKQTVPRDGSIIFNITPDPGYEIEDVLVDNDSIGPVSSYEFIQVVDNHTISAVFGEITGDIEVSVSDATGSPGETNVEVTVSVNDVSPRAIYGVQLSLVYDPAILSVKNTDLLAGELTQGWGLAPDTTVSGELIIIFYHTDALPYGSGTLARILFDVSPEAQEGMTSCLMLTEAIFNNDDADILHDGEFTVSGQPVETYVIEVFQHQGGTISPAGPVVVNAGDEEQFLIEADDGYLIDDVLADGLSVGAVETYKFQNIAFDHSIEAFFSEHSFDDIPSEWGFYPDAYHDYPYYLPVYGTAMIDGEHLAEGDWIGVFDEDGNCYGAGQYAADPISGDYYYTLSAYAASPLGDIAGFSEGEIVFFKYYTVGDGNITDAMPVSASLIKYPDAANQIPDPLRVDLSNVMSETIALEKGWNLISFNIAPIDPRLEKVFEDIVDKVDFVYDHMHWWDKSAGGSLTEIDPHYSYYVVAGDDCTLTVYGLAVELPYTRQLVRGWNSIAYHSDDTRPSLGKTDDISIFTGYFRDIAQSIIIIKDDKTWCAPAVGDDIILERNKGLFIKLKEDRSFTFHE